MSSTSSSITSDLVNIDTTSSTSTSIVAIDIDSITKKLDKPCSLELSFDLRPMIRKWDKMEDIRDLFSSWFMGDGADGTYFETLWDECGAKVISCSVNGEDIGYAIYTTYYLSNTSDVRSYSSHTYLSWIGVKKEFRKQGVGPRLMKEYLISAAKETLPFKHISSFYSYLQPLSHTADQMYRSIGYTHTAVSDTALTSFGYTVIDISALYGLAWVMMSPKIYVPDEGEWKKKSRRGKKKKQVTTKKRPMKRVKKS